MEFVRNCAKTLQYPQTIEKCYNPPMNSAETQRIIISMTELETAVYEFNPSERRKKARFFIDVLRDSPELFDRFPGRIWETGAELWVPDQATQDKHHILLSEKRKGKVTYERVRSGRNVQNFKDRRAIEVITGIFNRIGALVLIED